MKWNLRFMTFFKIFYGTLRFSLDRDQMEITGQKHILISPQQEYLKRYQYMLLKIEVLVLSHNSFKTVRSLSFKKTIIIKIGVVVAVIVWLLDLQLSMQSVPITTKARCTLYNIM